MFEFFATFNYKGITNPKNGSEYDREYDAYRKWERDFSSALIEWGDDLLGTRILSLSRNLADWRVNVRFIVVAPLTVEEQVERIQSLLFDAGGLSGSFVLGRERPFFVTYETTREVWALSPEQAGERVPGKIIRVGE